MTEFNITFTETEVQWLIVDSLVCRSGPTAEAQILVYRMLPLLPGTVSTRIQNQNRTATLGAGGTDCSALTPGQTTAFPEPCWATEPLPGAKRGCRKRTVGFLQCLRGICSFRGRGSKIRKGVQKNLQVSYYRQVLTKEMLKSIYLVAFGF